MASYVYNRFLGEAWMGSLDIDTSGDTIKVALLSSGYTPDPDHEVWADVSANEISGTGYSAGGKDLGGQSVTIDDANDRVYLDGNDVVWSSATITARHIVLYDDTHTSDLLICVHDLGSDITATGADWTAQWNAAGICRIT